MRDGVLRTPTSPAGVRVTTATTLAGAAGGQAGARPAPAPRQALGNGPGTPWCDDRPSETALPVDERLNLRRRPAPSDRDSATRQARRDGPLLLLGGRRRVEATLGLLIDAEIGVDVGVDLDGLRRLRPRLLGLPGATTGRRRLGSTPAD
ncbi:MULTISPECIES: hypothetical protein [Actinoalloteichus]|uniref:Uncharacterized protein n=1 Tax=Actinoalloteichus fjordicus TaxID=1612552 RepID=A0AAC9PTK4_9PSEU|nr:MULTISPECIES: hypothetical protein [Actinoalloteichus]APU16238.1 hypothetical protein UA74_21065 [Actinoalloteichus fjordicus]APU22298.1 hypothetical protein UA75_21545 [Actinoalloteichus sp. GBA129-24]